MVSQFESPNGRRLFRGWRTGVGLLLVFTPLMFSLLSYAESIYHSLVFERGFRERYEQKVTLLTSCYQIYWSCHSLRGLLIHLLTTWLTMGELIKLYFLSFKILESLIHSIWIRVMINMHNTITRTSRYWL